MKNTEHMNITMQQKGCSIGYFRIRFFPISYALNPDGDQPMVGQKFLSLVIILLILPKFGANLILMSSLVFG